MKRGSSLIRSIATFAFVLAVLVSGGSETKPSEDNFEGAYLVGGKECLVTPSMMSYEVRWRDSGNTEYYFFTPTESSEDQQVFMTDPAYNNGAKHKFVFPTGSFGKGTFYDEKVGELPVVREQ